MTVQSRWDCVKIPPKHRTNLSDELYEVVSNKDLMLALYDRYSLDGVAEIVGVARSTVQRYLIGHGAKLRDTRARAPLRDCPLPEGLAMPDPSSGRSSRQQVVVSLQRLLVLAGKCARPHCRLSCDYDDDECRLEAILQHNGDLERRPWEPEDHREYWARLVWSDNGEGP